MKPRARHPFPWLIEPLEEDPTFWDKAMFGCRASYYRGLLVLVCTAQEEPWNGVLLPTGRKHHESLQQDFPDLKPHAVLGKWLYLSQNDAGFESSAARIVSRIIRKDPRIGVEPKQRKKPKITKG